MQEACIICNNNAGNKLYKVPELQLGLQTAFSYQFCNDCHSLQLVDPPADFSIYYPNDNYYSFNLGLTIRKKADQLRKWKAEYLIHGKRFFPGALLSAGYKMPDYYQWMKNSNTQFKDAILDVGTGNGSLLTRLFNIGYTNLTGIDPFINESKDYGSIKILKKDIFQLSEQFDLIMMHHSLEHMFNPLDVLLQAKKLLKPGKCLLLRIPVMNNYGWNKYGVYWCGVDAPRHIFIPSEQGMRKLISDAGLTLHKLEYDSSDYVIWSSEQYKKHIPLHAENSRMINPENDTFSETEIDNFKKTISAENKKGNGDTAAYYIYND